MEKRKFIAYIRKSKKEHSSTLGLDAQKTEVIRYVSMQGGHMLSFYVEIESGTCRKLAKRTVIWEALDHCKREGATLIVAKLDRLARDVEFTSKLMNLGVKFVACDIPEANEFTIHVMAAVAEQEAKMISERTKAALARKKARGVLLGWHTHKTRKGIPIDAEARKKAAEVNRKKAANNPNNKIAMNYAISLYKNGDSYAKIAQQMNNDGYKSPYGNKILPTTVMRWIKNSDLEETSPAPDMA